MHLCNGSFPKKIKNFIWKLSHGCPIWCFTEEGSMVFYFAKLVCPLPKECFLDIDPSNFLSLVKGWPMMIISSKGIVSFEKTMCCLKPKELLPPVLSKLAISESHGSPHYFSKRHATSGEESIHGAFLIKVSTVLIQWNYFCSEKKNRLTTLIFMDLYMKCNN